MGFHNPTTYAGIAESIRRRFGFHSTNHDIEGKAIAVLSGHPFSRDALRHPLTARVARSADETRERYMTRGAYHGRAYPPDAVAYYVWDRRSGLVMAAVLQSGEVLDEITAVRPNLRPGSVDAIRDALAEVRIPDQH